MKDAFGFDLDQYIYFGGYPGACQAKGVKSETPGLEYGPYQRPVRVGVERDPEGPGGMGEDG
jgi:hypothetical protein